MAPGEQDDMLGLPEGDAAMDMLHADACGVPEDRWPQTLVDMIRVEEAVYLRMGQTKEAAFNLACQGVMALAEYFGGHGWYLPRGDRLQAALRDLRIFRTANRDNMRELASDHGLSERHIYRIIQEQHGLHLKKIQGRLFDEQGG